MKSLNKAALFNLILACVCWTCTCFSFYLLNIFIKYIPGDVYTNSTLSGFSAIGYIVQKPLTHKIGSIKLSLLISYLITFIAFFGMLIMQNY